MMTTAMKEKDACSWKKSYEQPRQLIKSRDITLLTKFQKEIALDFGRPRGLWTGSPEEEGDRELSGV